MKQLFFFLFFFTVSLLGQEETMSDYPPPPLNEEEPSSPPILLDAKFPDLESKIPDFVLETKQIVIEGYPDAFNPSIVRFQGSLLLCFRTYNPITRATDKIGLIWLDEEMNPISSPQILHFQNSDPYCLLKRQDPRLILYKDRLFIAYNNVLEGIKEREIRRMLLAEVFYNGKDFFVLDSDCFINFEGDKLERSEKNWVPFEYKGELFLAYSIVPHRILRPLYGQSICEPVASTLSKMKWDWGVLRGGTPALLDENGEYLAFFHCSKSMATVHSKGKSIPHYFMGAYTFNGSPPFDLTGISPFPIVGQKFYHGPAHKTWKPLVVVFPGGYVFSGQSIWVVYGRQDHELWAVKLDKQGLLNSLAPVSTIK